MSRYERIQKKPRSKMVRVFCGGSVKNISAAEYKRSVSAAAPKENSKENSKEGSEE